MQLQSILLAACISAALFTTGAQAAQPDERIVVKFRANSLARMQPQIAMRTLAANAQPVSTMANGAQVVSVRAVDADATLRTFAAHPDVQYAVRDSLAQQFRLVDDPLFESEVEMGNGQKVTKVQAHLYDPRGGIDAPGAWAQGATGAGIVVAVLDTGITRHPDLDKNVVAGAGWDFLTDNLRSGRIENGRAPGGWDTGDWTHTAPWLGQCRYTESTWHGTHVAGTIAAVTNNALGGAGIAYDAKILPVRVLGHCGGWFTDIADGITWASGGSVPDVPANPTPAEVLNLSLGGPFPCPVYLQEAIDGAIARGSVVVVAAGNDNADSANNTPANCKGVISVGSNGLTGKRAHYSSYGNSVTISAPGGGRYENDASAGAFWIPGGYIWSTFNAGRQGPGTPNYAGMVGTSMAAPHVAGIVAMMQGAASKPHAPAKIRTLLTETARMFPVKPDRALGAGIADANGAVLASIAGEAPVPKAMELDVWYPTLDNYAITDQARHFVIEVPENLTRVTFRSYGGTGDPDLYVAKDVHASPTTYDAKSVRPGTNGIVTLDAPAAGKYYVALYGTKAYSGVHLRATFE